MAGNEHYFVEWKEQYVSKERGNRVVHYFLKDNSGESILAVVGTERSVRHMFYVVSEEFLNAYGSENHAGFRWRSRREVVNWLTSMLSKQHRHGDYGFCAKDDSASELNALKIHMLPHKGLLARNPKGRHLDISWSGTAWTCGKQLKHYPAFQRNGISIAVQSFVFVMAEKENRCIAYLEDMYEDRKCQKKVRVRWFHLNKEVKGVVSLRNPHPKEVFITPYVQVISAECVDGPAIVLTRKHFEKCMAVFPSSLLGGFHFCFRQYKSNRIKPFKLCKLRGYFDQPIFASFSPDFFEEEEFDSEEDVKIGAKRNRSLREHHKYDLLCKKSDVLSGEPNFLKHVEGHLRNNSAFSMNDKVEFLCQDSGICGCWFRCTVIEISRRHIKLIYDDLTDEDSGTNLEEWVPAFRVAKADKLGMRQNGRPTVRPAYPMNEKSLIFEVGDPADAWWSDGWWEGVICGTGDCKNGAYQIYIPGENLHLNVEQKDLRISKDWVGDRWVDVEPNPNILSLISSTSMDTKLSTSSAAALKEVKSDHSPTSCHKVFTSPKLSAVEEEIEDLEGMTLTNVPLKDDCTDEAPKRTLEAKESEYCSDEAEEENADYGSNGGTLNSRNGDDDNNNNDSDDNKRRRIEDDTEDNNLVECEIAEMKCDVGTMMDMLTES
ncbi:uncharacterized protein LOC127249639 [Andrographis paniculata]|uniref:uncharacterized protein LOC127249639 n=1 Tax=Andrographis paniculata TaxID=175694 RepID=UPI0021E99FA1|nr:uncharacterized protein LOC127249639 [Andrographis paniculata]